MLVLKLCQQFCPEKLIYTLGNKLGDGADGEVFDIANDDNKVLKLSVLYQQDDIDPELNIEYLYNKNSKVLSALINAPTGIHARVYEYGSLGIYSRIVWGNQEQKFLLYYYVMEKLSEISKDERKVFHSLISHEDQNKKKDFSPAGTKKILKGLARGLDFDAERIIFFCDSLASSSIEHLDLHPRNIMKDVIGNFKLIDFDRTQIKIGD